jgi:diguanylate cyclase (GGDEF)-like protein
MLLIGWSLPAVVGPEKELVAGLILLALPASMVKVNFPRAVATLTMCQVLNYLALLLVGPGASVLVAAVGGWGQCTFRSRVRNPAHQTLFSVAALALAAWVSGAFYLSFGGRPEAWDSAQLLVALSVAATTFFLVNSGLVAAAIGLTTHQSIPHVWSESFLWSWPGYLLGAAVAAAALVGIQHGGLWLMVILTVPLVLTFQSLRAYVTRWSDSITDLLTGLPNQRHVVSLVEREIARARRRRTNLAIMLCDVDGFKSINDTYGHLTGDLMLRHVGQCLQHMVRGHDSCARYGGDEFLIVLPDCTPAQAERRRLELQAQIEKLPLHARDGADLSLRLSVGTANFPDDGETLDELLASADVRMYKNKLGARLTPGRATSHRRQFESLRHERSSFHQ